MTNKLKQYWCSRCNRIFRRDIKYGLKSGRHICPDCFKPRNSNKGKKPMSPQKRLGLNKELEKEK